ncbi:transposase [Methylococcus geothermalis]|uniref:Transposase n=1 Tax=Methylococcus geothermalis TaxID=2681310 RepID=A0A858Q3V1_9GAMM|nr:transposase [Methylococcus geothermalis]
MTLLKYRPEYPLRPFADLAAARQWVMGLVRWYNHEHRHSAIRFVTPAQRHAGHDTALLDQRKAVYEAARARHPQRWRGPTRNWQRIQVVHLNPDQTDAKAGDPREGKTEAKKAA